jgi:PAS domain S-box-containing protein
MTISSKLWIGFGTQTALLLIICAAIFLEMQKAQVDLHRLDSHGQPRREAVHGLEINLLKFTLGVRAHLDGSVPEGLAQAALAAENLDRHAADYERLVTTSEQAALSRELQQKWRAYHDFVKPLLVAERTSLETSESIPLTDLHRHLASLIANHLRPQAASLQQENLTAALDDLERIGAFVVILLSIGGAVAVTTSVILARGILRSEQALAASEERLRLAVDGSDGAEWELPTQHGTSTPLPDPMFIGPKLKSFIGFTDEEFPNSRDAWIQRVHPEDAGQIEDSAKAHLEARAPYHKVEYRVRHKDGSWRWISSTGRAYRDEQGNVIRWAGIDWDITERKENDEALRASEERFRGLQQATPDGFMIFKSVRDETGRIVDFEWFFVNPAAEKIVGRTDLVGKRLLKEMPGNGEAGLFDAYIRVTETGEVWQNEFLYESEGLHSWFRTTAAKVDDGFAVSFADVTQRHEAETKLEQSRRLFATALEAAEMGTWVYNLEDQVCEYDERAQTLYGLLSPRLLHDDRNMAHLFHPDDLRPISQAIADAIKPEGDLRYHIEYRVRKKAGGWRWLRVWGLTDFEDRNGKLEAVRIVGASHDITEARRSEEALKESDRKKDEFLAILAHELRNPLAAIRMALNLTAALGNDPERLEQMLAIMNRQSEHLVRLIDDLLDISRITRGRIELRKQKIDLKMVLGNAVEAARSTAEGAALTLLFNASPEPLHIEADPVRIAQIVGNLLNNACKYTNSGGTVEVTAAPEAKLACVRVRDTGVGLAEDQFENLFAMFAQVDPQRDRAKGGLGIGLALAKNLVELHDGTIEARSDGPGLGAEFVIRIPLAQSPPTSTSDDPIIEEHPSPFPKSAKILAIDDNTDALHPLAEILRINGYSVKTAETGEEGIELAAEWFPEIVLLDIGLPDLDGYEVARRLRQHSGANGQKLIAMTGWGQESDKRKAVEAGFDAHLTKPVEPAMLLKLLETTSPHRCSTLS